MTIDARFALSGRTTPALPPPRMLDAIQNSDVLGRLGTLEVRLARDSGEMRAAQRVRHAVFCAELGANSGSLAERIEADGFDALCDHLIVVDTAVGHDATVGTYRLLRREQAIRADGFYSQGEYDLSGLLARQPHLNFLEMGRSCVLPAYRSRRTIELLWQGLWAYINRHEVDALIGCASFQGVVPARHALGLSFLAHFSRAEPLWDVRALPGRHQPMDLMPAEAIDTRAALTSLPPLVKGYLRCGARVGDGCVIDHDFGTVDVFMVMPVKNIARRYTDYYSQN